MLYCFIIIYYICYTIKVFLLYKGDYYFLILLVFNLLLYNIYILYSCVVILYLTTFRVFYLLTFYIYCKTVPPILHTVQIFKLATTLSIGFVNIHPILLYLVCILGVGNYLYVESYRFLSISISILVWISITALLLGMYWGVFSFLWGFFWVNDLVEWFLLSLIILLLSSLHNTHVIQFKIYKNFYIFFLLIYISTIRLNFFFTRHSFFFSFFINNLLLYFLLFSLTSTILGSLAGLLFYLILTKLYCIYFLLYSFLFYIIWVRNLFLDSSSSLLILHYSIFIMVVIWSIKQAYYLAFFYMLTNISYSSTYYFYINYFTSYYLYLQYSSYKLHSTINTIINFTLYSWFYSFIIFYKVELSLSFLLYFYIIYIIGYSIFKISKVRLIWV